MINLYKNNLYLNYFRINLSRVKLSGVNKSSFPISHEYSPSAIETDLIAFTANPNFFIFIIFYFEPI